jgi:hypothetical protein
MSFAWVLVLLQGFALPIQDMEITEDILNLVTNFNLSAVTDELVRCAAASDVVLECVDKLTLSFHALDVGDKRLGAYEDLCTCLPTVDGRGVREYGVGGDGLVAPVDVECRVG